MSFTPTNTFRSDIAVPADTQNPARWTCTLDWTLSGADASYFSIQDVDSSNLIITMTDSAKYNVNRLYTLKVSKG